MTGARIWMRGAEGVPIGRAGVLPGSGARSRQLGRTTGAPRARVSRAMREADRLCHLMVAVSYDETACVMYEVHATARPMPWAANLLRVARWRVA